MKKYFSILVMLLTGFAFTSCYDVPEPYGINAGNIEDEEEVIIEPSGSGTVDDPYNVAGLIKAVANLAAGTSTSTELVVKGIVSQVKNDLNPDYGNLSYYISDDGKTTEQFYVYRGLGLNGEKFTSNEQVAIGDVVVVQGTVKNYNGTLEFDQNKSKLLSTTNTSGGGGETVDILGDVTFYEETLDGAQGDFTIRDIEKPSALTSIWSTSTSYHCMRASGYDNTSKAMLLSESWLISPVIDLRKATEAYLTFEHAGLNFKKNGSTDNTGEVIKTQCFVMAKAVDDNGEWKQVELDVYPTGNTFVITANNSLNNFCGHKIQFAFKYTSDTNSAGTWEVKNVKLTGFGEKGYNGLTWDDFANGDFSYWDADGKKPEGWQTNATIGNATIARSEDCVSSPYSVLIKGALPISRLAYQELGFETGTYTLSFQAKAATQSGGSVQVGYTTTQAAGSVTYEKDATGANKVTQLGESWQEVSFTFTVEETKALIMVIAVPSKSAGKDVLVDDVRISKEN